MNARVALAQHQERVLENGGDPGLSERETEMLTASREPASPTYVPYLHRSVWLRPYMYVRYLYAGYTI
jgi:hypothetical protein